VLDPQVRSPVDETGVETPTREPALTEPPTPRIDISTYDLNAGDEVTLDGGDSTAFRDLEIDSYDWTIVPPNASDGELDVDGDGRPELIQSDPGPGIDASGPTVTEELPIAGTYEVYLTVTDEAGERSTRKANLRVEEPPPPEVFPVATDAGEECYFPPTGEAFPATGENAARHFGYGCGDWKVYRVVPGESYRVVAGIDDCPDCLLSDATFTVQEPAGEPDDVPGEGVDWEVIERQPDPIGKSGGGRTVAANVVPDSAYIRVRNRTGTLDSGSTPPSTDRVPRTTPVVTAGVPVVTMGAPAVAMGTPAATIRVPAGDLTVDPRTTRPARGCTTGPGDIEWSTPASFTGGSETVTRLGLCHGYGQPAGFIPLLPIYTFNIRHESIIPRIREQLPYRSHESRPPSRAALVPRSHRRPPEQRLAQRTPPFGSKSC
jgi:hypothetical protein